ncbi:MAG: hypothetical protein DDT19_00558 [Syntrophomonadaceae bacterium]|nr:hypothetical protein [Bacillota bacterium]
MCDNADEGIENKIQDTGFIKIIILAEGKPIKILLTEDVYMMQRAKHGSDGDSLERKFECHIFRCNITVRGCITRKTGESVLSCKTCEVGDSNVSDFGHLFTRAYPKAPKGKSTYSRRMRQKGFLTQGLTSSALGGAEDEEGVPVPDIIEGMSDSSIHASNNNKPPYDPVLFCMAQILYLASMIKGDYDADAILSRSQLVAHELIRMDLS